ncbi:MAG: outer membrane lipid asymmetry maintenance protein MlaD [Desulfotalea sp.]
MKKRKIEFFTGLFVIIGSVSALWLFTSLGGASYSKNHYLLHAYFTSVSGLKNGANIELAGVSIGKVTSIELDTTRYLAKVSLSIRKDIEITEDTIASVKTSGIIGDKYINLLPGGSEEILENNGDLYNTESSLDIESLVSKYIFEKKDK